MKQKRFSSILVSSLLISGWSTAAILPITSMTHTAVSGNPNTVHVDLLSITVDGVEYTDLTGATVTGAGSSSTGSNLFYASGEANPGQTEPLVNAALSGLRLTTAKASTPNDITFQFGRTLTSTDILFFYEFGGGNESGDPTFQLVDNGGSLISGATLSLTDNYGPVPFDTDFSRASGGGDASANAQGTSFVLSDFNSYAGTLATGFRITDRGSGNVDPVLAGVAVIPEPSSLILILTAVTGILMVKRTRKA